MEDIDGDGDLDIISLQNLIILYGMKMTVLLIRVSKTSFTSALEWKCLCSFFADIDGDGDLDIVSAADQGDIVWHENDGAANPSFTKYNFATRFVMVEMFCCRFR